MMKLGILTGKARTPAEMAASSGEGPGDDSTLPAREPEREPASLPDEFVVPGAGEPYRPRHAADAAEAPMDSSELPTGPRPARHRRDTYGSRGRGGLGDLEAHVGDSGLTLVL
jgi:hypothetical protein